MGESQVMDEIAEVGVRMADIDLTTYAMYTGVATNIIAQILTSFICNHK